MTLFDIDQRIRNAMELEDGRGVDLETGEVIDDFEQHLDALQMERDEKLENIALYIKNLTAEAKALEEQEKIFSERKRVTKNKLERLKQYLASALDGDAFKTAKVAIGWRKSQQLKIADDVKVEELPSEFIKVALSADRTALKQAIKEGREVYGVELVDVNNIQIR